MSILGRFLRDLVAPERPGTASAPSPAPALASPATATEPGADAKRLLGHLEDFALRLRAAHQLGSLELEMRTAAELRALLAEPRYGAPGRLERHGYKVWSQNDEDGILAEIFRRIGAGRRTFVEFGVTDGRECNTRKLVAEGWSGLWMEFDAGHCTDARRIHADPVAAGRLEIVQAAVTKGNVEALVGGARVAREGELDLLSIDIDGNDYYVWAALRGVRPRVVVIEFNGKFPPPMDLVPPYDETRFWDGSDYGGASLQALAGLGARKGYRLVGTNITGVNAFFVREDLAGDHFAPVDTAALYNSARIWLTPGYAAGHPPGERFRYTSDAEQQAGRLTPR